METGELIKLLQSETPDDRLRAARHLALHAGPEDLPAVQEALARETNKWIRGALIKAREGARQASVVLESVNPDDMQKRLAAETYAEAVQETTQKLLHEIQPIVGRLVVSASDEIPTYPQSKTCRELELLRSLLDAIAQLGQAATPPVLAEFDLAELIHVVAQSESEGRQSKVETTGLSPLVVLGSRSHVHLALRNAVLNAIEATEEVGVLEPVVVSWGETDRDYWIAVLDSGCGLPTMPAERLFEINKTTKAKHFGMGLASARQAAESLQGEAHLTSRHPSGAKFEFRWPKF